MEIVISIFSPTIFHIYRNSCHRTQTATKHFTSTVKHLFINTLNTDHYFNLYCWTSKLYYIYLFIY